MHITIRRIIIINLAICDLFEFTMRHAMHLESMIEWSMNKAIKKNNRLLFVNDALILWPILKFKWLTTKSLLPLAIALSHIHPYLLRTLQLNYCTRKSKTRTHTQIYRKWITLLMPWVTAQSIECLNTPIHLMLVKLSNKFAMH